MAGLKFDPLDNFADVAKSQAGRLLLFFAAGWTGILLARIAVTFSDWSDFQNPSWKLTYLMEGFWVELAIAIFWPVGAVAFAAGVSCFLAPLALAAVTAAFLKFFLSEESQPLLWLSIVFVTSAAALFEFEWELPPGPGIVILGIFWVGLGAASWWVIQLHHSDWIERADDLLKGRKRPTLEESIRRKKVSPEVWGKPVKGWDDEEEEEEVGKLDADGEVDGEEDED